MYYYRYEIHTYKRATRKYLIDRVKDSDNVTKRLEELRDRGEKDLTVYLERDVSSTSMMYNIYTSRECNCDIIIVSFASVTDAEKYIASRPTPDDYWIVEKKINDCNLL